MSFWLISDLSANELGDLARLLVASAGLIIWWRAWLKNQHTGAHPVLLAHYPNHEQAQADLLRRSGKPRRELPPRTASGGIDPNRRVSRKLAAMKTECPGVCGLVPGGPRLGQRHSCADRPSPVCILPMTSKRRGGGSAAVEPPRRHRADAPHGRRREARRTRGDRGGLSAGWADRGQHSRRAVFGGERSTSSTSNSIWLCVVHRRQSRSHTTRSLPVTLSSCEFTTPCGTTRGEVVVFKF